MLNNLSNQNVQWLKQFLYQQGTNSTNFDIAVRYSELMDNKNIPHTFIISDDYIEITVTDKLSQIIDFNITVADNNTAIIAAAPELLNALEEMVLNFEDIAGNHCDDCEELIEKAKQAIAKAKGK